MKVVARIVPSGLLRALVLVFATTAMAGASERLLIAFVPDTDWPPYMLQREGGVPQGVLPDLLREVAEPLGYDLKLMRLPNKRGWRMLDAGEVDVHFKAMKWVKEPERYLWSDPVFASEDVLLYRKDNPIRFDTLSDLEGLRIAVIESFVYPGLDQLFESGKARAVPVASPFDMLKLVEMGRVDAASVNRAETLWLFRTREDLHGERFAISEKATDVAYYRFVFSRQGAWGPFIKLLNRELQAMREDGRLESILAKYR